MVVSTERCAKMSVFCWSALLESYSLAVRSSSPRNHILIPLQFSPVSVTDHSTHIPLLPLFNNPPSFFLPSDTSSVQLSHGGIRLVPGSHGDEADLVRDQGGFSTSPKIFNINSTLRSLGKSRQTDSLVALVLIGAWVRSERGGLVFMVSTQIYMRHEESTLPIQWHL